MSRCSSCGISKKSSAFGYQKDKKRGVFYVRAACKDCRVKVEKRRYQTLSQEQIAHRRNRELKRLYGITLERYNELFSQQLGCCLGCGKHQSGFKKALAVDHHHSSSQVRALLCQGCNLAIGNAKENPQTLINLAKYLEGSEK